MHLKKYYFINKFNPNHIKKLDKDISIIYRNYRSSININLLLKIRDFCKKNGRKFYLSNNIKFALKYNLNGVYLPAFNKSINHLSYKFKKKFLIIGSAHNLKEIKIKEKQGCDEIFISPLFKIIKKKGFLNISRFNYLCSLTKKNIIALGGINEKNFNQLNSVNSNGFASISWIKKNRPIIK